MYGIALYRSELLDLLDRSWGVRGKHSTSRRRSNVSFADSIDRTPWSLIESSTTTRRVGTTPHSGHPSWSECERELANANIQSSSWVLITGTANAPVKTGRKASVLASSHIHGRAQALSPVLPGTPSGDSLALWLKGT